VRLFVVVSVLDRCSAVWRFGAGGLVVVPVVVLVLPAQGYCPLWGGVLYYCLEDGVGLCR